MDIIRCIVRSVICYIGDIFRNTPINGYYVSNKGGDAFSIFLS